MQTNCGFYQVKISGSTDSPLLCRWLERLNSSAPERCPRLIALNAAELQGQSSYQTLQCETEPQFHLSDNDGLDLLLAHLDKAGGWMWHQHSFRQCKGRFDWSRWALWHNPQLQYTNKHLMHDPQNKDTTLCCSVGLFWHHRISPSSLSFIVSQICKQSVLSRKIGI